MVKKNSPLTQVAIIVAAIVAVEKFLSPMAYSRIFLIPRLDHSPKARFATKNPIKIAESKLINAISTQLLVSKIYN